MTRALPRLAIVCLVALSLAACGKNFAAQSSAANLKEATAFLEKNAKVEGIKTTPSGLQYKVITSGPETGVHPRKSDEVKVNYEGKLLNGTVFDSSYERGTPATFVVGAVVPGWTEALQMMRPGDVWEVYIPPALGYGENGTPGGEIPSNSALTFKIELLDVFQHPG